MNSKRTRRTPQGIAGVTFSQGLRLEKSEEKDYLNIGKYLSKFKKNGDVIKMPLNRYQRRLAKKLKLDIKASEVSDG